MSNAKKEYYVAEKKLKEEYNEAEKSVRDVYEKKLSELRTRYVKSAAKYSIGDILTDGYAEIEVTDILPPSVHTFLEPIYYGNVTPVFGREGKYKMAESRVKCVSERTYSYVHLQKPEA